MNTYFRLIAVDAGGNHYIGIYSCVEHALSLFESMPELTQSMGWANPKQIKIEECVTSADGFLHIRDVIIENYI